MHGLSLGAMTFDLGPRSRGQNAILANISKTTKDRDFISIVHIFLVTELSVRTDYTVYVLILPFIHILILPFTLFVHWLSFFPRTISLCGVFRPGL